jgi:hypothetical protein
MHHMKRIVLFLGLFTAAAIILILTTASSSAEKITPVKVSAAEGFALAELFTSQGCSSCPAADRLLGEYAQENKEHIITLAFHVDYWNRLGWKDPFSNAAFSDRQRHYASSFGNESVYTPQAVINGSTEIVGSDAQKLATAISSAVALAPKASITINTAETKNDKISCTYTLSGAYSGCIINAALVQRRAETAIRSGENNGLMLTNYNVVRDFITTSPQSTGSTTLTIPTNAKQAAYRIVLYLQEDGTGKIIAAVKKDI